MDLLEQELPRRPAVGTCRPGPRESYCLAATHAPAGLAGNAYRALRAQAAWAYRHLAQVLPAEQLGPADWRELGALVARDPGAFLAALPRLDGRRRPSAICWQPSTAAQAREGYRQVVRWCAADVQRVVPVPPGHWLLVQDDSALRDHPAARGPAPAAPALHSCGRRVRRRRSSRWNCRPRQRQSLEAELVLDRFAEAGRAVAGRLRLLAAAPALHRDMAPAGWRSSPTVGAPWPGCTRTWAPSPPSTTACWAPTSIPTAPCDRHVLAKRLRAWVNADGFLTALDGDNLVRFEPGPPARWSFVANAGDGRTVEITLMADIVPGRNTLVLGFRRPAGRGPARADALTLRVDLEDRGFHSETHANPGVEAHFTASTHTLEDRAGFAFEPAGDRQLRGWVDAGHYHAGPEWSLDLPHPVEASRGMTGSGDAWSPGWFEVPLPPGSSALLVLCADADEPPILALRPAPGGGRFRGAASPGLRGLPRGP